MQSRTIGLTMLALLCCCAAAQATLLKYDVTQRLTQGPPYPALNPIGLEVVHMPPGVPAEHVHTLNLELFNVTNAETLAIVAQATDNGMGGAGSTAMVDFSHPTNANGSPLASHFDLFFEYPANESQPELLGTPSIVQSDGWFDVFFDVSVRGVGTALHRGHFKTAEGGSLHFDNVMVNANLNPGFHLTFDLNTNGVGFEAVELQSEDDLLFTMKLTGKFTPPIPEPTTATLGLIGLGAFGLAAFRRRWRRTV